MELTATQKKQLLENLGLLVEQYEQRLLKAEEDFANAQNVRDGLSTSLSQAQELLEDQRSMYGSAVEQAERSPYAGLSLQLAASKVIERAGKRTVSLKEIEQTLRASGYTIESKYPGRAIHAALLHDKHTEKVRAATYQWIFNGTVTALDRSEEEGRGSVEQGRLNAIDQ